MAEIQAFYKIAVKYYELAARTRNKGDEVNRYGLNEAGAE